MKFAKSFTKFIAFGLLLMTCISIDFKKFFYQSQPTMTTVDVATQFTMSFSTGEPSKAFYFYSKNNDFDTNNLRKKEKEEFIKIFNKLNSEMVSKRKFVKDVTKLSEKNRLIGKEVDLNLKINYKDDTYAEVHYVLKPGEYSEWKVACASVSDTCKNENFNILQNSELFRFF
ncbi:hypothetical protein [Succinivibrio dextrinosolvens]|uniref:hypothetical protein n=1 Tax=Succinivibrio dextrinosolvens TaxID=83771 RepID=UPI001920D88A|nr:hypothetical protein [Succinivibrio dextrinosolvens]